MTTFSHISVGYLIAHSLEQSGRLNHGDIHTAFLISIISSILPDLDVILKGKLFMHRKNSLLHIPLFWILIIGIPYMAIDLFKINGLSIYLFIIAVNILMHFVMDSFGIDTGISWLAPIKKRNMSFFKLQPEIQDLKTLTLRYISHPLMLMELGLWLYTYFLIRRNGLFF